MSRLIDVSLTIGPDLLTWPGDPPAAVERTKHLATDGSNVSRLTIGTHSGTHVDPPVHFVEGTDGVDRVPVDLLVGACLVADARGMRGPLGAADLDRLGVPEGTERLVLRSDNSDLWRRAHAAFPDEYVCLSPEGAAWVVRRGIRLLGVDFLSVEQRGAPGHPTHVELLSNGVVIVEGLDLGAAEPGSYTLAVLPLKIAGGDGGPARAVLIQA